MNDPGISKEKYLQIAGRFGLTGRQLELGYLKVSGFSNRRIAYMLGISEQTVKNHFTAIYEKAWVPGRAEFRALFSDDGGDGGLSGQNRSSE
jgi:DNA-binding CsgD family transcriptional regulator